MSLADRPYELEPWVAPEFCIPEEPELRSKQERAGKAMSEEHATDREESFDEGVFGLRADGRRKFHDDDDDSDLDDDDLDYDDDEDEEDIDDDFDDDADDSFDDDVDDFLEKDE